MFQSLLLLVCGGHIQIDLRCIVLAVNLFVTVVYLGASMLAQNVWTEEISAQALVRLFAAQSLNLKIA